MQNTAKNEYYEEYKPSLTLVKNDNTVRKEREQYYLYYNSGVFPILLFVILFLCVGVIINIGMRIQNLNYDRTILNLNQAIRAEKDRSDRLNLKISQLKSPSLIASAIEIKNNSVQEAADAGQDNENAEDSSTDIEGNSQSANTGTEFRKLDIFYSRTASSMNIAKNNYDNTYKNINPAENTDKLNLGAVADNVREVLLVVSEGILTFFIP
jgi:cell division protein FtsL